MSDHAARTHRDEPTLMDDLARRPRLLLVDDDAQRAQVLAAAFSDDYEVAIADSPARALKACDERLPDLLLIDASLPGDGAVALCRRLLAQGSTAETPVVVITEGGDQVAQLRVLEAGAVDFIARPVHPKILRSRVSVQVTLKRQADLLRQWVYIDGLTGVCNPRYFDERLAREWGRAVRQSTLLSVLRVDIDCFALYNQHSGHALGDDCLRRVATLLKGNLKRPGDLVARLGGGEFICLLPDTDLEGSLDLAHRLCLAVRGLGIAHAHSSAADVITVSMGLANKPVDVAGSVARLLELSLAQLDKAKSRGRNQACGAEFEDA